MYTSIYFSVYHISCCLCMCFYCIYIHTTNNLFICYHSSFISQCMQNSQYCICFLMITNQIIWPSRSVTGHSWNPPNISFNLSHTDSLIACAVTGAFQVSCENFVYYCFGLCDHHTHGITLL